MNLHSQTLFTGSLLSEFYPPIANIRTSRIFFSCKVYKPLWFQKRPLYWWPLRPADIKSTVIQILLYPKVSQHGQNEARRRIQQQRSHHVAIGETHAIVATDLQRIYRETTIWSLLNIVIIRTKLHDKSIELDVIRRSISFPIEHNYILARSVMNVE